MKRAGREMIFWRNSRLSQYTLHTVNIQLKRGNVYPEKARQISLLRVVGYQLFEGADVAWSLVIVSTYFGTFVVHNLHSSAASYGWAITLASLVVAFVSPVLGAAADQSGSRQPYLRVFTVGVVLFTGSLAFVSTLPLAVGLFVCAYVCANFATRFYTALLPAVSNQDNLSTIASVAVALGYVVGLASLVALSSLVPTNAAAQSVFIPFAMLYLILAMPTMLLTPDFPIRQTSSALRGAYAELFATFRHARNYRDLIRFLTAYLLASIVSNAVINFMGRFGEQILGYQSNELQYLYAPGAIVGAIGALCVFAPLIKHIGARRTLLVTLVIWFVMLVVFLSVHDRQLFQYLAGPLVGLGLSGVATASRTLIVAFSPLEKSAEFWGLYGFCSLVSMVLGDLTFTTALYWIGDDLRGFQTAFSVLMFYVVIAFFIVWKLPNATPSSKNVVRQDHCY